MSKLLILLIAVLVPVSAGAEMTVKDYRSNKDDESYKLYIASAGNAYNATNGEMLSKGLQPLYCPPDKSPVPVGSYQKILDKKIASLIESDKSRIKEVEALPISVVLLQGLKDTFPCGK